MQDESSPSTGPTCPDGTTCGPSRLWPTPTATQSQNRTCVRQNPDSQHHDGVTLLDAVILEAAGTLTSSAAGSPARTSVSRARGPGSVAHEADSGTSSPALFASFDPDTCSWRTSQRCLFGGWIPFSGRWPRTGTMRSGSACRLRQWVPRIGGTGCSSWPTPQAFDAMRVHMNHETMDSSRRHAKGGCSNLVEHLAARYPTPSATDYKGLHSPGQRRGQLSSVTEPAANASNGDEIQRMSLNPAWVEWLMGFPAGWTDCEDSATP
jgi:hypothetical protein